MRTTSQFNGQHKLFAYTLLLAIFTQLVNPTPASAKDLGVHGTLYPIAEPDIRVVIIDELATKDMKPYQDQLIESGTSYSKRLRSWNLPAATRSSSRYFKPEFEVQRPVYVPQLKDGRWEWIEMGRKGEIINMRDKVSPHTAMLVIDGRSAAQRAWAKEVLGAEPFRVVVVLSDGDPIEVGAQAGRGVFYLTDWLADFFGVRATPSLLYAPRQAEHARELGVTEFAPPYSLDKLREAWK